MRGQFVRLEWENNSHTIGTIYIRPDKPYFFTPGQYTDIGVTTSDGVIESRTMTITTLPSDKLVGFTTRFNRRGSAYKKALLGLKPGNAVTLTDAMGDLVLPLDSSIPLVFVAGGVAMASYVSMLRWLTEQHDSRQISLLYAVRAVSDIIYTDVLTNYASVGNLTSFLYTPDVHTAHAWPGTSQGERLSSEEIMHYVAAYTQIYLSGTEKMVEQLRMSLQNEYKIPQYRLAFDFFDGYTEI